ncbi:MAG: hypothetical protein SWH54_00365 [Thermodesulfobacteriota bacterium]|nr:hypothetical protein [Thermodesulfobacteriota bacterium]
MNKRQRAMCVIKQLKAGEWKLRWNPISQKVLTAHRNGAELWCGNGGFFTDIDGNNVFGYLWRHIVYWVGIRPVKKEFEKQHRQAIKEEG